MGLFIDEQTICDCGARAGIFHEPIASVVRACSVRCEEYRRIAGDRRLIARHAHATHIGNWPVSLSVSAECSD